jgi:hypothetical protein
MVRGARLFRQEWARIIVLIRSADFPVGVVWVLTAFMLSLRRPRRLESRRHHEPGAHPFFLA